MNDIREGSPGGELVGELAALFRKALRNHFGMTDREQLAASSVIGLFLLGALARFLAGHGITIR